VAEVEHKHRELDRSERRYRELVERIPLVTYVYETDPEGVILYTSPQVAELTGVDPEEYARDADLWLTQVHPDDLKRVTDELDQHIATGDPLISEYRLIARDGTVHWVDDHSVIAEVDGVSVSSGYWQDITARKELERQLQQAQRMEAVGLLAGGIAHDFNNILSVITVSSQTLLGEMSPDDPGRPEVEEIIRAADRVTALTRQLVAFSRRQVLRPERVDVNETVVSMDRMLSRLLGVEVTVVTDLHADPCLVEVDPGQLEQVIVNLAVNARDAMPRGGVLSIATRFGTFDSGSEWVRLLVRDDGDGMDDGVLGRVFEPFFTTKEQGTGLGLATVYGIVQQSHGTISVWSEPGKGTTFEIALPRLTVPVEPVLGGSVPTPASAKEGVRLRILLVEDNDDVRRTLRRVLERFGHDVNEAVNGQEALDVVGALEAVDLVLTDVAMPTMGGIELVRSLREDDAGLPVIYMSGFPGPATDGMAVETDELTVFMAKPFGPSELREAIDGLVAKTQGASLMRPGGFEPPTSRSGGERSIP
jgi:two-component system, cell cycle sensor histidine kinase and response regulator CckA